MAKDGFLLYGSFLSAPSYRVALMLRLCGLRFDYRHVDLAAGEHKSPEFREINRFGQVPALRHGGRVYVQSNAILQHLAARRRERSRRRVDQAPRGGGGASPRLLLRPQLQQQRDGGRVPLGAPPVGLLG